MCHLSYLWENFTLKKLYFSQTLIPLTVYKPSHLLLSWILKQCVFCSRTHYYLKEQRDKEKLPLKFTHNHLMLPSSAISHSPSSPAGSDPAFVSRLVQLLFYPRISKECGVRILCSYPGVSWEPWPCFSPLVLWFFFFFWSVSRNNNRPYLMGLLWRLNEIMHITWRRIINIQ